MYSPLLIVELVFSWMNLKMENCRAIQSPLEMEKGSFLFTNQ